MPMPLVKKGSKIKFNDNDISETQMSRSHSIKINSSTFRTEVLNGQDYIVAPVVLITEGILNGFYYPAEELQVNVMAWNNRPVPVNHPSDANGNGISANSPDVMRKDNVGSIFNVNFEAATSDHRARVKGEIWLNVDQVLERSEELWNEIDTNQNIEVSTGLFIDSFDEPGEFLGEKYNQVARNYVPDHLAVLPGGVGACDWSMGCGIRANKKESKKGLVKSLLAKFNKNRPKNNELSHGEIREKLRSAVLDIKTKSPNQWVWIREAFNDRFVYEFEDQNGMTLFQQSYMVDSNDNIVLDGDPMEVKVETKFVPVQNSSSNDSPDEDLDNNESDEEPKSLEDNTKTKGDNVTKEEKVIALIKNDKTDFGDADKDSLLKMNESSLDLMIKNCPCGNDDGAQGSDPAPKAKPEAKAPEANSNEGVFMTPEMIAEMVDKKLAAHTAKGEKDALVKVLKDNGIELAEEEISSLSVKSLEVMAKKTVPQNNHRGVAIVPNGSLSGNEGEEDETPEMPDFINHCQEDAGVKLTPTL